MSALDTPPEQGESQGPLDILMTKHRWSYEGNDSLTSDGLDIVISHPVSLSLLTLLHCYRSNERDIPGQRWGTIRSVEAGVILVGVNPGHLKLVIRLADITEITHQDGIPGPR